ncbi:MAG: hypothetical protein R6U04_07885 [Bacteroidales bacterium]
MAKIKYKKLLLSIAITFVVIASAKTSMSQTQSMSKEVFGVGYNIETSRLLSNRMFIEGNYTLGRRTFEVGITPGSYNTEGQGFMFRHKVFLNRNKNSHQEFNINDYNIRTFGLYKFVTFSSNTQTLRKTHNLPKPESAFENPITSSTINTIEHYLGFGVEFKLVNKLFIETIALGGINFIKNNSEIVVIEDKLLPKSDLDFAWNISMGMNYRF